MTMAWVAVGSVAVGAAGSIAASSAQSSAIKKAGQTSADASAYAADKQQEMYDDSVRRYEPYSKLGLSSLPYLQSAILGGPVEYEDPNYQLLSDEERAQEVWKGIQSGKYTAGDDYYKDIAREDAISRIMRDPTLRDLAGEKLYRGADGSLVGAAPKLSATYDHKASPAAQYQLQQGNKTLGRALAARGLSGSGQAATALGDLSQRTYAEDYDKQISRMGSSVDVGRGAATSTAQAGQNTAKSLANIGINQGKTAGDLAIAGGDAKAGLYSGLGGTAMQGANLYMLNNYLNKAPAKVG